MSVQAYMRNWFGDGCRLLSYVLYSNETAVTFLIHPLNISLALPGLGMAQHGHQHVALLPTFEAADFKMTSEEPKWGLMVYSHTNSCSLPDISADWHQLHMAQAHSAEPVQLSAASHMHNCICAAAGSRP